MLFKHRKRTLTDDPKKGAFLVERLNLVKFGISPISKTSYNYLAGASRPTIRYKNPIDFGIIHEGQGAKMGGSGSGRWYRWESRKSTVEESLGIAMKDFRKRLFHGSAGTFTWTRTGGHQSSIGYRVNWKEFDPSITLHYRRNDIDNIEVRVHLETSPTQFGGHRWWFTCPLIVGGRECKRRVGKLFLPAGARYFGCRTCHGLTYRSSQEAHQTKRLFAHLGFDAEVARLFKLRYS